MTSTSELVPVDGAVASLPAVNPGQSLKATKALLTFMKKTAKEAAKNPKKRKLFDDLNDDGNPALAETPIWLSLTTKTFINNTRNLKPCKITVPHPLHAHRDNLSICLIVADPQRAYKDVVASDHFPTDLRKKIGRVIGFTKLRSKYHTYEAQRQLYAEYDIFLADDRIQHRLPKVLGKTFYKSTQKRPIPVVFAPHTEEDVKGKKSRKTQTPAGETRLRSPEAIAHEIEKAVGAVIVHLMPTINTNVKIGYANWEPEHLAANLDTAVQELVTRRIPRGWSNVRAIYIKGPETTSLPVFMANELWVDEQQVAANSSTIEALEEPKANIGKKRKSLDTEEGAPVKKVKKAYKPEKKKRTLGESNDAKLDEQIKRRKQKLKEEKQAAKRLVDEQ